MSAEACLAGLFPPHGYEIWNRNINWQPIPVHTVPIHEDYVLNAHVKCDRYDKVYAAIDRNLIEQHEPLIKYLEKHSGRSLRTLYDISKLHDTLKIERSRGYRYGKRRK